MCLFLTEFRQILLSGGVLSIDDLAWRMEL